MSKPWTLRQENALQQAREDIDTALECIGAQNEADRADFPLEGEYCCICDIRAALKETKP